MEVYTRKHYFNEEEEERDELASLAKMEAGVSSHSCYNNMKKMNQYHPHNYYYHKYYVSSSLPHFLDCCFLCKKRIGDNKDIFMYRGDTPFCSEECREEEIKRDETKKKKHSLLSSSVKAMRINEKQSSCDYALHFGTVVTV